MRKWVWIFSQERHYVAFEQQHIGSKSVEISSLFEMGPLGILGSPLAVVELGRMWKSNPVVSMQIIPQGRLFPSFLTADLDSQRALQAFVKCLWVSDDDSWSKTEFLGSSQGQAVQDTGRSGQFRWRESLALTRFPVCLGTQGQREGIQEAPSSFQPDPGLSLPAYHLKHFGYLRVPSICQHFLEPVWGIGSRKECLEILVGVVAAVQKFSYLGLVGPCCMCVDASGICIATKQVTL